MRSKILFIASLLVVTLGITSCNQQRKQQKATTETATATSLTTQSFTDVVGNKLDLTFDSEKNSATIHFGGETAELAGQVTASGYCYKNEHYELLGKGNDVQLLKDGQVVFAHEDEKVEIEAKNEKGEVLTMIFNNTEDTLKAYLNGGDQIDLVRQQSASGIWYANDHYELRGKGDKYQLLKDGVIVFRN